MNLVRLVVMRHGQSIANVEQRFAGSIDVALTELGEEQAGTAGLLLRKAGIELDQVLTSQLSRAQRTAELTLQSLGQAQKVNADARLNERRFGTLEGMKFTEAAEQFGPEWGDPWLLQERPPGGESMEDVAKRLTPLVEEELKPTITQGTRWLLVAHGNTIRVLDTLLCNGAFPRLEKVPPATPLLYDWNGTKMVSRDFLASPNALNKG